MNYLLDTHVFVWLAGEPNKLSRRVAELFTIQSNEFFLSVASVWEMQIKIQLGKLKLNSPLIEVIAANQKRNRIQSLSISIEHVLNLANLPDHHRDPFDRMLVAQASTEDMVLLTSDAKITQYAIRCLW